MESIPDAAVPVAVHPDGAACNEVSLPLHAEDIVVSKRRRETVVRLARTTVSHAVDVDEELRHEQFTIERVAVGAFVDAVPTIRQDGDTSIYPIVEEILVTEKRLFLKEEVRVKRVDHVTRHRESVTLRAQHVEITRTKLV